MPTLVRAGIANPKLAFYLLISLVLAVAPAWLRQIVVSGYDPADTMGSGGDVFGWYGFVLLALVVDVFLQIGVAVTAKFLSASTKVLVISLSILLWTASMVWVHQVRVL